MGLINHIKTQWNEYSATHDYLADLRKQKITRSQRWDYLNPHIKGIDNEFLLENIVNNFVFLAFMIRHPIKFGVTYWRTLREIEDPSRF